ncbi:Dienelactone hydrolase family protein [Caulobacter sp. RHG1]|nr:Dienelactone hydrolase family protein [Caulobacter sp. RHG1]
MDHLAGFERFDFDDGRWTREVFRIGSGPAVIVIHEVPGLHPGVLAFARDLADAGLTAWCPSLFGTPAKQVTRGYAVGEILKNICVRREFRTWKDGRSSPIVDWLRALARKAHQECGGRGVGAVGMCFTGGFALANDRAGCGGAGDVPALVAARRQGRAGLLGRRAGLRQEALQGREPVAAGPALHVGSSGG